MENHYDTNPYHYVLNNPMLYMDYMGLDTTYNGGSLKEVKITGPAKGNGSGNSYYGYGSGWGGYDPFDTDNGYGGSGEFGSFNFMIPPPPPPVLSSSSGAFTSLDNRGVDDRRNKFLATWGAGAASLEHFSGITRLGSDLSIRTATATGRVFYGNQFVKTLSLSKIGKNLGTVGAVVGLAYSTKMVLNGELHPAKYGVDVIMTGVGLFGGPIGAGFSIVYFGVDAFFPEFWPGVGSLMKQGQEITKSNENNLMWHVH